MYTLKGEIKVINETRAVSEKFKLREFVITDASGQYPQIIQFQSVQDRCEMLDTFNTGDMVEVFFNLRGREWTNPQGEVKVFNTLDAWKIQPLNAGGAAPTTTGNAETFVAEGDDDLPF
tara:strand:- start:532 stop:888 length:357 start_codon:yes stop_codon:yes gene_type:complete